MADAVTSPKPRARDLYNPARDALSRHGLTADAQTKMALFLGAAKQVNALFMAAFELQPGFHALPYQLFHAQLFREVEHVTLLARVTKWSWKPHLYAKGGWLAAPLWRQLASQRPRPRLKPDGRAVLGALAFGHAVFSEVRLTPVLPAQTPVTDPFAAALRYVEQENGRMVQTQIRLLKDGFPELSLAEREEAIVAARDVVEKAFLGLMEWLCDP
jgi:hypothetical protein